MDTQGDESSSIAVVGGAGGVGGGTTHGPNNATRKRFAFARVVPEQGKKRVNYGKGDARRIMEEAVSLCEAMTLGYEVVFHGRRRSFASKSGSIGDGVRYIIPDNTRHTHAQTKKARTNTNFESEICNAYISYHTNRRVVVKNNERYPRYLVAYNSSWQHLSYSCDVRQRSSPRALFSFFSSWVSSLWALVSIQLYLALLYKGPLFCVALTQHAQPKPPRALKNGSQRYPQRTHRQLRRFTSPRSPAMHSYSHHCDNLLCESSQNLKVLI